MGNSPFTEFGTDPDLETNGVWLDFGDYRIKIARRGGKNERYESANRKAFEPYKRQLELEMLPESVAVKVSAPVFADTIILGWEGIKDAEGNDYPFTRDNCIKLLIDVPEMFTEIRRHADRWTNFRRIKRQDEAGNS